MKQYNMMIVLTLVVSLRCVISCHCEGDTTVVCDGEITWPMDQNDCKMTHTIILINTDNCDFENKLPIPVKVVHAVDRRPPCYCLNQLRCEFKFHSTGCIDTRICPNRTSTVSPITTSTTSAEGMGVRFQCPYAYSKAPSFAFRMINKVLN